MALNVGTATTQDQLIVYLHSYLLGIGALYEPRRFNRTLTSRTDDAAEWHWNARPLLRSTTWRTYTTMLAVIVSKVDRLEKAVNALQTKAPESVAVSGNAVSQIAF